MRPFITKQEPQAIVNKWLEKLGTETHEAYGFLRAFTTQTFALGALAGIVFGALGGVLIAQVTR